MLIKSLTQATDLSYATRKLLDHNTTRELVDQMLESQTMHSMPESLACASCYDQQSVLGLATEVCSFRPRQSRYAMIIPIWNEGQTIVDQLQRMRDARIQADTVLCDGGSTDGSTEKERLELLGVRSLLVTDQIGLGTALRLGIGYALDEGYDGVIMIDGNGKDGVEAIPEFEACLSNGYDFVQGSRFMVGGKNRNTPLDRYLGIRFLIAPLMRFASGFRYTDPTNGFKGMSRKFLLDSHVQPLRPVLQEFNLQFYLNYTAARLGFRVTEIPVSRIYPKRGPTPTKIVGVRKKLRLLRQLLETVCGSYDCPNCSGACTRLIRS